MSRPVLPIDGWTLSPYGRHMTEQANFTKQDRQRLLRLVLFVAFVGIGVALAIVSRHPQAVSLGFVALSAFLRLAIRAKRRNG